MSGSPPEKRLRRPDHGRARERTFEALRDEAIEDLLKREEPGAAAGFFAG